MTTPIQHTDGATAPEVHHPAPGSPRRVQLSRKRGWRLPPNTVVVARPSKWGNPYRIGDAPPGLTRGKMNREDVCMFFELLAANITHEQLAKVRRELGGKNLACWCSLDGPCHADTLLKLANTKV